MVKKVIEGSHAVAEAVRLCEPDVIAAYPITPQTHIVERLSQMKADGDLDCEYLMVESEHSAMSACIGAQATGVRTYTATASAGLALMHEMLHVASGMRLPIVMSVANRSLSSPLSIWNDWSDSMAARDTGWIQLYVESSQEALDTVMQAYKIAEETLTPVMVCMDGFYLSHTYEPVDIPESAEGFIEKYKPYVTLDTQKPITQGMMAGPNSYQDFKQQQYEDLENSKDIIKNVNEQFKEKFNRSYGNGLIELYNMDKAKHAIVTMGSVSSTIKHVLDENKIEDIGLIRIKSFRPFPYQDLQKIMEPLESIGVFEKDVSLGLGGALWSELNCFVKKPIADFIGGLGGRDITEKELKQMFELIRQKDTKIHWIGSNLRGE